MIEIIICPKCESDNILRYRHLTGRIWCADCGYVIKEEGKYIVSDVEKLKVDMKKNK